VLLETESVAKGGLEMSKRFTSIALCILVTVNLALLLSCGGVPDIPKAENKQAKQQGQADKRDEQKQQAANHPEAPAPKSAPSPKAMGEVFDLGGFRYRIVDVVASSLIGDRYVNERPDGGAVFVIVTYDMENLGKESRTVAADDLTLLDSGGREFSPSSRANTALAMTEHNKDFLLSQMQPGIVRRAKTAFEVPQSSAQGLILSVHEKGFFGTGTIQVALESAGARQQSEKRQRQEEKRKAAEERRNADAEALAAKREAQKKFEEEHPDEAATKKFTPVVNNARQLIKLKIYGSAREKLKKVIDEAPGTDIAEEAKKLLESIPQ
jgi:sRNA-binding protein